MNQYYLKHNDHLKFSKIECKINVKLKNDEKFQVKISQNPHTLYSKSKIFRMNFYILKNTEKSIFKIFIKNTYISMMWV